MKYCASVQKIQYSPYLSVGIMLVVLDTERVTLLPISQQKEVEREIESQNKLRKGGEG
jgi:hypothetical protein